MDAIKSLGASPVHQLTRSSYMSSDMLPHVCCSWRFPRSQIKDLCEKRGLFTSEDVDFQEKIAYRTGLGDDTAVCPAIQSGDAGQLGIEAARFEFGATCFTTIEELLNKTGIHPKEVDFVITNSSLFNPTPSLSAMVLNYFKMSSKTISYSLGGMGCSAGEPGYTLNGSGAITGCSFGSSSFNSAKIQRAAVDSDSAGKV